jgi:hypothetical protein
VRELPALPLRRAENRWRKSLTQDNYTDTTDDVDESGASESELLRNLRKQLKEKDKELAARPDREALEAEIRNRLKRESAIETELMSLGHPAGIRPVVEGKLGDAEVNRETVAEALRGIGYQIEVPEAPDGSGGNPATSQSDLANVASLSAQVRSIASGGGEDTVMKQIAAAKTPQELAEIAAKGGFLTQY